MAMMTPFRPKCLGQVNLRTQDIEIWVGVNDEIILHKLTTGANFMLPKTAFDEIVRRVTELFQMEVIEG